jgi:hypothetical protein
LRVPEDRSTSLGKRTAPMLDQGRTDAGMLLTELLIRLRRVRHHRHSSLRYGFVDELISVRRAAAHCDKQITAHDTPRIVLNPTHRHFAFGRLYYGDLPKHLVPIHM